MNRHPLITVAALCLPIILACSSTDCGRTVNKVVPAVREVDPEFATAKVDCETPFRTPSPKGCAMKSISCGETIEGNNQFGERNYDDLFYVKKFCGTQRHAYEEASEAIYLLQVPSNVQADVTLSSDCADLDIASISVPPDATNRCPTISHSVQVCEMDQSRDGGSVRITTVDRPENHFIVIDGKDGQTGNFRLRVDCKTYR
jgi:hypothetical protein